MNFLNGLAIKFVGSTLGKTINRFHVYLTVDLVCDFHQFLGLIKYFDQQQSNLHFCMAEKEGQERNFKYESYN